jgi:hypothetical protein
MGKGIGLSCGPLAGILEYCRMDAFAQPRKLGQMAVFWDGMVRGMLVVVPSEYLSFPSFTQMVLAK